MPNLVHAVFMITEEELDFLTNTVLESADDNVSDLVYIKQAVLEGMI